MLPAALFDRAGLVTDRFTAVHLTHPMTGTWRSPPRGAPRSAYCPSTELDLGDGFLPVEARERLRIGRRLGQPGGD